MEQYPNRLEIVQLDDTNGEIRSDPNLCFEHPYPPTKVIFIPDKECQKPDLLATSSDWVWRVADDGARVDMKSFLNNNRNSKFSDPLTSFDWNEAEPKRISASSIDITDPDEGPVQGGNGQRTEEKKATNKLEQK